MTTSKKMNVDSIMKWIFIVVGFATGIALCVVSADGYDMAPRMVVGALVIGVFGWSAVLQWQEDTTLMIGGRKFSRYMKVGGKYRPVIYWRECIIAGHEDAFMKEDVLPRARLARSIMQEHNNSDAFDIFMPVVRDDKKHFLMLVPEGDIKAYLGPIEDL